MDVVDPYAYPLVYGKTPALTKENILKETPQPKSWYYAFSTRFSYLPTTFSIAESTEPCRATAQGYINGVPPHMPSMSQNIETIVAKAVPLFEHVLTDLHRDNPSHQRITGGCKYDEETDAPQEPEPSADDESWASYDKAAQEWAAARVLIQPDVPEEGYSKSFGERKTRVSLRGRKVNVVVRMTEIRLVSTLKIFALVHVTRILYIASGLPIPKPLFLARGRYGQRAYRGMRVCMYRISECPSKE